MIRVIVSGHNGFYGLSDVLRLFYGRASENREEGYIVCEDDKDLIIRSEANDQGVSTYIDGEKDKWNQLISATFNGVQLEVKREIKRQLYYLLTQVENKTFPWGALTGIRPTLVANEVKSKDRLVSDYLVRSDKASLCIETANKENEILGLQAPNAVNVYVGVPFCPSRCAYCSFVSQDINHHLNKLPLYADALTTEIRLVAEKMPAVSTLYLGGGTPTVFDDKEFAKVIYSIAKDIKFEANAEITVEAGRPDTINEYKLSVMKDAGIRRICINPQTMSDETLRRFNRQHTVQDVVDVFELARKLGFDNINMDLIAGLNSERPYELIESLKKIFELDPENITIHTLYKKKLARLTREQVLGGEAVASGLHDLTLDEVLSEAYSMIADKGYNPYYMYRQKDTSHGLENVGFAKVGTECLYNVAMMSDKRDVMAFGAGGVCKRLFEGNRIERCSAPKDVITYIRDVELAAEQKLAFFEY